MFRGRKLERNSLAIFCLCCIFLLSDCNKQKSALESFNISEGNGQELFVTTQTKENCLDAANVQLKHLEPMSNTEQAVLVDNCNIIEVERRAVKTSANLSKESDNPTNLLAQMEMEDMRAFSRSAFCQNPQEDCQESQYALALLYFFAKRRKGVAEDRVAALISEKLVEYKLVPKYLGFNHMQGYNFLTFQSVLQIAAWRCH